MSARRRLALALALCAASALACQTTAPKKDAGRAAPSEPWRDARPPAAAAAAAATASSVKLERADLKNGMALFVVEDHGVPMVTAAVVVRAGSAQESVKDAGIAGITFDLLDEGAGPLNNLALANAFASLGSALVTSSTRDAGVVSVRFQKKHADAALDLLGTVVRKPTFAQADFDRVKARRAALRKARPVEEVAGAVADGLVFGAEHPYGHDESGAGSDAAFDKLTVAKARKFWSDHAGPKNAALVVVGDVSVDEAKAWADKHFGKWSGGAKAPKPPADAAARAGVAVGVVDVGAAAGAGAADAYVHIARALFAPGDADEAALVVVSELLGGAPGVRSSRLDAKLRDEKKWSGDDGASVASAPRRGRAPFAITVVVDGKAGGDAAGAVLGELEKLGREGASAEQLARTKDAIVKRMPGALLSDEARVHAAATLFVRELAADHYDKLAEAVKAVSAEDVKKLAVRIAAREDLVVVVAGDAARLVPQLEALKLTSEILRFDRDGNTAPAAPAAPPSAAAAAAAATAAP